MEKNIELIRRFVKDNDLPIPIIGNCNYFNYFIQLYEKDYKSLMKYEKLKSLIEKEFNNKPEYFLNKYYEIRDTIIKTVENSGAYQKFNTMDMSIFSIKDKPDITANNIYNENNVGHIFVSFDLKKANFQALKYADPKIVINANTYEEFISNFTNIDYIINSKHIRQIVFGKMNPKRHIAVEKYIINKVYEYITETHHLMNCVSMSNDELVFDMGETKKLDSLAILRINITCETIRQFIQTMLGFEMNLEVFKLHKLQLCCDKFKRSPYYYKEYLNKNNPKGKLMCVPMNYFAIVYKLFNNLPLQEEDYHFDYEGLDSKYCENFYLLTDFQNN